MSGISDICEKELQYVPPNHGTLVGFRGLLLQQRLLRQVIEGKDGATTYKIRPDTAQVLTEGLSHIDIMEKAVKTTAAKLGSENLVEDASRIENTVKSAVESIEQEVRPSNTHQQLENVKKADELLFERFKALFFWPAIMSSTG